MNLSCPRDIIVVKWIRLSCKAPPIVFDLHQPDAAFHAHAQLPSSHVPGWLCFACWSCFLRNSQEQRHEGKNSPRWEALRPYCVQDILIKCERFKLVKTLQGGDSPWQNDTESPRLHTDTSTSIWMLQSANKYPYIENILKLPLQFMANLFCFDPVRPAAFIYLPSCALVLSSSVDKHT